MSKNHYTVDDLSAVDWTQQYQPENHPFKLKVSATEIRHLENGDLVAQAMPGYQFYWVHDHIHLAPIGWKLDEAEYETKTQVAKPLDGSGSAAVIAGLMGMIVKANADSIHDSA